MSFVIASDHPCLPGHFPGRPLVPGVVLLDRVVAAIEARHGPLRALRLPQVKFVAPLLPDEVAQIELTQVVPTQHAQATGPESPAPRWRFRVLRGDTLLASGEIVADAA